MLDKELSTASENYLEVIFDLAKSGASVRSVDVATRMNVSKASVNKAIGILKDAGMVDQQYYGMITLTPLGKTCAQAVDTRHKVIKRFLIEVLGVDNETADQDACKMEHVVSEQTIERWKAYMKSR